MFNAEVNRALNAAAALINTAEGPRSARHSPDTLQTVEDLQAYLSAQEPELQWADADTDADQVERVRRLRADLRRVWEAEPAADELELINELLDGVGTQLARSAVSGQSEVVQTPIPASSQTHHVLTAPIAAALAHLVVAGETGRLRICRGDDCEAAIVDLTRNRSKLFCDFGNCANRSHVRAYRARRAAQQQADESSTSQSGPPRRSRPSAAQKAKELSEPSSDSAVAAKEFRSRMREELMETREKKSKKKKKDSKKK